MKFWTKIPVKVREQITRAARLFGVTWLALITPVLNGTVPVSWGFVCSTVVAAAEVVFRQFVPVTPVSPPASVRAPSNVTIIPTQAPPTQ